MKRSRFIDPRILIFRTALNASLHDLSSLFFETFITSAAPAFPADDAAGKTLAYRPPNVETAQALYEVAETVNNVLADVGAYCEDLLAELQNLLVGDLFGTTVEARQPTDPACKVIQLDNANELENWFLENTPWGEKIRSFEVGKD